MRIFSDQAKKNRFQMVFEIILLILILGVLGGFFLIVIVPGINENRAMRKSECLSNVKQITTAAILYANDNDDCLPPHFTFDGQSEASWFVASTGPSLHKNGQSGSDYLFVCPYDRHSFREGNPVAGELAIPGKMSYVHCNSLKRIIPDYDIGKRILNVTAVANPETTAYLRDPIRSTENGVPHSAHGTSSDFTFGFLDGHAGQKKEKYAADL